jgi:hypothetical protein
MKVNKTPDAREKQWWRNPRFSVPTSANYLLVLERLRDARFQIAGRTGCKPCPKVIVRVVIQSRVLPLGIVRQRIPEVSLPAFGIARPVGRTCARQK